MRYSDMFHCLNPGFFEEERIRALPEDLIFTELVMDLRGESPSGTPPVLGGITFGEYRGALSSLHSAVRRVDEDWVKYFREGDRFYCAFDGDRIVSFCGLPDMGRFRELRVGGPGCVGTIPEYRGRGIGLEMVRLATETLRRDGYDLSWIHYTHLEGWYAKLGYRPILRWNSGGIVWKAEVNSFNF
ncbi:MAG: GNAT family N-acetyltransferase [Bacteroides sp.]|nr:GNAT family N-acetyltransferase [Eubacterium sp.]MCM1418295.1 GNAT family N-acetyltransferase [Roseburia sp.]MCM1462398.1 GNAT family N-acetyltransferase [Bacteroides sp.]